MAENFIILMALLAGLISKIMAISTAEELTGRGEEKFRYPVSAIHPINNGRAGKVISEPAIMARPLDKFELLFNTC